MTDSYEQRLARRLQQEHEELADQQVKQQLILDRLWQAKLDAEAPLDDGMVEIAGFRVPRYRTSCHVGKHDPDFGHR